MKKSLSVIALLLLLCSPVFSQTPDLDEARRLAAQGDAEAQTNLGVMYANGEGVPQNDAEAVKWSRLAAAQGYAIAQYNLGVMYANGAGVSQNYAEAVHWYRLAAEQGHAIAQYNLGVMYANGRGVPQNYARAYLWFSMAAAQGNEMATENREKASEELTSEALNSAQQLATRCFDSGYTQCE